MTAEKRENNYKPFIHVSHHNPITQYTVRPNKKETRIISEISSLLRKI